MTRIGSGYSGSSELLSSGNGDYEIIPDKKSFYKFEFVSPAGDAVIAKINNSDEICLWNGYFNIDKYDAPIHSFVIVTPAVDFYWYGAY